MAYYAIFSIGPLLVLVIAVAGLVFGEEQVRKEVSQQVRSLIGEKSAGLVESMMTAQKSSSSQSAAILGIIGLVLGASGVFGQLQDSLNTIWEVTSKPGKGIWAMLRDRFLSMAMVLGIGFLLLISMALSAFISAFSHYIGNVTSMPPWVTVALNEVVSFLVVSLLFSLIFKVLPDVRIKMRDVWLGGVFTGLLFTGGKVLLGLYLGRQVDASAYGAGSAFIVILLYIYYSSLILFFGAELTRAMALARGVRVQPGKYAVQLTRHDRARQGIPTKEQVEAPEQGRELAGQGVRSRPQKEEALFAKTHHGAGNPSYYHTSNPSGSHPAGTLARSARMQRAPRPWSFVGVALGIAFTAGLAVRYRFVRKALGAYVAARTALSSARG